MTKFKFPNELNIKTARQIVKHLGGDPDPIRDNWCWEDFKQQYPDLLEPFFKLIESAKTGDPAWAAFCAGRDLGMPKERVFKVIENAKTGNPAYAAYRAGRDLGMPAKRVEAVRKRWEK